MIGCPACQADLPRDAQFCGFCGFRLRPISAEDHRRLADLLAPLRSAEPEEPVVEPIALTKVKVRSGVDVVPGTEPTAPVEIPSVKSTSDEARASKRQGQRFPMKVDVNYHSEHNFYTGLLQNISSGGLFIATHQLCKIGDSLEITFSIPGLNRVCVAKCVVRWVRDYDPHSPDMVPGMGVQFESLDNDVRAAVELFIKHRDPIFFDDE